MLKSRSILAGKSSTSIFTNVSRVKELNVGIFVPRTIRSLEHSFPGTFVPGTVRSLDNSFPIPNNRRKIHSLDYNRSNTSFIVHVK